MKNYSTYEITEMRKYLKEIIKEEQMGLWTLNEDGNKTRNNPGFHRNVSQEAQHRLNSYMEKGISLNELKQHLSDLKRLAQESKRKCEQESESTINK